MTVTSTADRLKEAKGEDAPCWAVRWFYTGDRGLCLRARQRRCGPFTASARLIQWKSWIETGLVSWPLNSACAFPSGGVPHLSNSLPASQSATSFTVSALMAQLISGDEDPAERSRSWGLTGLGPSGPAVSTARKKHSTKEMEWPRELTRPPPGSRMNCVALHSQKIHLGESSGEVGTTDASIIHYMNTTTTLQSLNTR